MMMSIHWAGCEPLICSNSMSIVIRCNLNMLRLCERSPHPAIDAIRFCH